MFRSFDHPQAGILNMENPMLTTDLLLLDHVFYLLTSEYLTEVWKIPFCLLHLKALIYIAAK
jgi:hypothetical protein